MKILTTKEAWEKIAAAFAQYADGGPGGQEAYRSGSTKPGSLAAYGLCGAVNLLYQDYGINFAQLDSMYEDVRRFAPPCTGAFYWPITRAGARHRAMAATILAEDLA